MLRRETLAALAVETLLHASAADEPAISAAELELWERLVEQVDAAGCQPEALRSELLLEQVRAAARLAPACAGAAPRAGAAH